MIPKLQAIDHVYIFVKDRAKSELWYRNVLGLHPVKALEFWARDGGPLTIANSEETIHLALFESNKNEATTVAFSVSGQEYLKWFQHLKSEGLPVNHNDHEISWSVYFKDPDGNPFEITSYDYEFIKVALSQN